jgi:tyrosyl-DNA phosphodiesterase-1
VCPAIPGDQDDGLPANKIHSSHLISSPFQLTHIQGLPDKGGFNEGAVKLRDILGDPMIKECWQFNYCFDVDFLMSNFDQDVRGLVQVKIVHGSWERESMNKIRIDVSMLNALTCIS